MQQNVDQKWLSLIHSRSNLLLLLNFNRSHPKTTPAPLLLRHGLMTFNHDYYCTLLVTAEIQSKPADANPDIMLLAYDQQQNAGSPLLRRLPPFNTKQIATCKRFTYATHVSSNDHFSSSFFYTCQKLKIKISSGGTSISPPPASQSCSYEVRGNEGCRTVYATAPAWLDQFLVIA